MKRNEVTNEEPPRRITTREFFNRSADLLDEIEFDGVSIVLTRNGRPAAILIPVSEASRRTRVRRGVGPVSAGTRADLEAIPKSEPEPIPNVELSPEMEEALLAMARQAPRPWEATDVRYLPALGWLEIHGLSDRLGPGRHRATPAGIRLAEAISERRGGRP